MRKPAFPVQPKQRVFIVGATGSGKSTTVKTAILPFLPNRMIIDPKRDFQYPDCKLITDPEELSNIKPDEKQTILYRPEPEFMHIEYYNAVYKWIYLRQNTTVYTDEVIQVMNGRQYPHYLMVCITAGRSLGITMISGTQRPTMIPLSLLTESEHYFMHELRKEDDKERMSEFMCGTVRITSENVDYYGVDEKFIGKKVPIALTKLHNKYGFFYYDVYADTPTKEFLINIRTKDVRQENTSVGVS